MYDEYCRSGNFRVRKSSCFKYLCKNIFVVKDTNENFLTVLNRFYVLRFGDLERNTARQENVEFAAFVAVGELLAREERCRLVLWYQLQMLGQAPEI